MSSRPLRIARRPGMLSALLAAALFASALCTLLAAHSAFAVSSRDAACVAKALGYAQARQNADGGFSETGSPSSDAITAWAIIAIASAGEDPNAWRPGGASPVDYLAAQSSKWKQVTDVARTTLAVVAAGRDPRNFGGVDLVQRLNAATHASGEDAEQIGPYVNSHIWGMLALAAAGETPSRAQAAWLLAQQNADGGWGWAQSVASDSNDTAAALEALAAAGTARDSESVRRALAYLRARQNRDGGFSFATGTTSDTNSTSWVIQGLVATGEAPASWKIAGHSPLDALASLQRGDGSLRYTAARSSNALLSTLQALPALSGRAFPVAHGLPAITTAHVAAPSAASINTSGTGVVSRLATTATGALANAAATATPPAAGLAVGVAGAPVSAAASIAVPAPDESGTWLLAFALGLAVVGIIALGVAIAALKRGWPPF